MITQRTESHASASEAPSARTLGIRMLLGSYGARDAVGLAAHLADRLADGGALSHRSEPRLRAA